MDPQSAAYAFLAQHFPGCCAAFLAGSVVRGEGTRTSDLDLVIITHAPGTPFRASYHECGWPIEAFIHSPASCRYYQGSDAQRRSPAMPMMCAEGVLLRDDDGEGARLKEEARAILARGPAPFSAEELAWQRYMITDLLDDLEGARGWEEAVLIVPELLERVADLILVSHGCWIGRGKWLLRALRRHDPATAERVMGALRAFHERGDQAPLLALAEEALEAVGGRLFAGYTAQGKMPA
jgi:hypothetical protein